MFKKSMLCLLLSFILLFSSFTFSYADENDDMYLKNQYTYSNYVASLQTLVKNVATEKQRALQDVGSFPRLYNGDVVSDELYNKYSNGKYCAQALAYEAFQRGWQYNAVVGTIAFLYAEGLGMNGTFTYEGCWTVTGPAGYSYDRTLNNDAWRSWANSDVCASQMINTTSWYSPSHYATGLGFCAESSVWDNGVKTLDLCDRFLDAADSAGVAWQDLTFQLDRAFNFLCSANAMADPDWRDPTTFTGSAEEYVGRLFAVIGYPAMSYGDDNGQLSSHVAMIPTAQGFVDELLNGSVTF